MPLKILMLHGYTQNASIFASKIGAVRKAWKGVADLVFLDAPHIVPASTIAQSSLSSLNSVSETVDAASPDSDPTLIPRAWWRAQNDEEGKSRYVGWEEGIREVCKAWEKEGGFDGVVGFSQGATMAAIVTSLFLRPHLLPQNISPPTSPPLKPLLFSICVAGFRPVDKAFDQFFPPKVGSSVAMNQTEDGKRTEMLFVMGKTDAIVAPDRAQTLPNEAEGGRSEWHDGGHFLPSKASWRAFLKEYVSSFDSPTGSRGDVTVISPSQRGSGDANENGGGGSQKKEGISTSTPTSTSGASTPITDNTDGDGLNNKL